MPKEQVGHVKQGLKNGSEIRNSASMLARPWFQRCWIIQESVLSKRTIMYCEFHTIDWNKISAAMKFLALTETVRNAAEKSLYPVRTIMGQMNKNTGLMETLREHSTLVSSLRVSIDFESKDPRDIIELRPLKY